MRVAVYFSRGGPDTIMSAAKAVLDTLPSNIHQQAVGMIQSGNIHVLTGPLRDWCADQGIDPQVSEYLHLEE